jgi:hypothetical protein
MDVEDADTELDKWRLYCQENGNFENRWAMVNLDGESEMFIKRLF